MYKATIDEVREVAVKMMTDTISSKDHKRSFWKEIAMIAELRCCRFCTQDW